MTITMQSTARSLTADGIELQIWNGETDTGVPCLVLVRRVVPQDEKTFEALSKAIHAAGVRGACGWE